MDNLQTILTLYIEKHTVFLCFFNGKNISILNPYNDSFIFKSTSKLLHTLKPSKILVDTLIGFSPILNKENIASFHRISINHKNKVLKNLSKGENRSLKILSSYFGSSEIVEIENIKILGYLGSYPIEKVQWNTFYLHFSSDELIKCSPLIKHLFTHLKTSFGKVILTEWLSNLLQIQEEIKERRNLIEFTVTMLPKILKLIKRCKEIKIDRNMDICKLRRVFKTIFQLTEVYDNTKLKLKNKSKYVKLFKIIKLFEHRYLPSETVIDSENCDWINTLAVSLSNKFRIPLSIIFFPEIGFVIESSCTIEKAIFRIKDKFYCKNKDMRELDIQITDWYKEKNKKMSKIFSKLMLKMRKIKFFNIYEFIGEIDTLATLAANNTECYNDLGNSTKNTYKGVEISSKNIIFGDFCGIELVECILLNQIGCKISDSNTHIPIYKKLIYLNRNYLDKNIQNSSFQSEIIRTGIAFRESDQDSCCIIEEHFQHTMPIEGFKLLSAFIKKVCVRTLFISTKFEIQQSLKIIDEISVKAFIVQNKNSLVEISDELANLLKDEVHKLDKISKWLLFFLSKQLD